MRRRQEKNILIVEDEAVISLWLAKTLDDLGYRTSGPAASAKEALRLAATTKPDLVLMDIVLDGPMDGIQAAKIFQEDFGVPVVFISARDEEDLLVRAENIEPYGFIAKPVQSAQLRLTLEIALRIKAEEKTSDIRAKFDQLVSQSPVVIFTLSPAEGFPIISASDNCESVFGYAAREFQANPFLWHSFVLPEDLPIIDDYIKQALLVDPPPIEHRIRKKNGEIRWLLGQWRFIRDETGNPTLGVGYQLDITPRKLAEEGLRKSEAAYRLLAENTEDVIWTLDKDLRFTYISPSILNLRGFTPEEAMRETVSQTMTPESYHAVLTRRRTAPGDSARIEIEQYRKDGSTVWVECVVRPVLDATGTLTGYVGVSRDIGERRRAERVIRESEERFRSLWDAIPHAVEELDMEGRILFVNKTFREVYGAEGIPGKLVWDYCADQEKADAVKTYLHSIVAEQPAPAPFFVKLKDKADRTIHVQVNWNYHRDPDGGLQGLVAVRTDVSHIRRSEEILREKERTVRALLNGSRDYAFLLTPRGVIKEANESFAARFGLTPENIRERRILDVVTNQMLGEARRKRSLDAIREKRPIFFEDEQDGRYFEHAVTPVINDHGEVDLLANYSRDVTEWKLSEQALRESEERFAALFKFSPEIAALTSFEEGVYLEVNEAFLQATGYAREDVIGKTNRDLRLWADPADRDDLLRSLSKNEACLAREARIRRKDGKTWPALFSAAPVVISGKRLLLTLAVDISERKALEKEVLRAKDAAVAASKAKTEFLTRISHEIRTPMNSILGLGEMLVQSGLDVTRRGYVDSLMRAGDHLLSIINDVLDFSSIEAGRLRLEKAAFDPSALLLEVMDFLTPRCEEKGLFLRSKISAETPAAIVGDAKRLWQVLMNLGGNAVKFTNRGGVTLKLGLAAARNETPALLFEIQDTGIGIPKNAEQNLFKDFSRLPDAHGRFGGSGLGLAISKRLVENMGGKIGLGSDSGCGSRFFFTLPLEEADPAALPRPMRGETPQKPLSPPADRIFKTLLAEDNPANVNIVKLFLGHSPFEITVAENGAQAVSLCREQIFDVILMDIDMPIMDGCEASMLIRNIEREKNRPPVPIIALTAHAFLEHKKKMADAGCTGYLAKPIRKNKLIADMLRHIQKAEGWPAQPEEPAPRPASPEEDDCVFVGPNLQPIIPAFLDIQKKNLERLRLAVEENDYLTLRRLGHNLRGAALTYGFRKMSVLGERLEKAALEQRIDLAANTLRDLTKHFHNVHIVYEDINISEDDAFSPAGRDVDA
jgi:two-component system, sensor histidine kinase and response regulator